MKHIWKYKLPVEDNVLITMPVDAQVLCCQLQDGQPHLWALIDPNNDVEVRYFRIVGTGHPFPDASVWDYLDTFQLRDGQLVFHVFQEHEPCKS